MGNALVVDLIKEIGEEIVKIVNANICEDNLLWKYRRGLDAGIRYLDKMVDELAKGKKIEKILR